MTESITKSQYELGAQERALLVGDLSSLTEQQRGDLYARTCQSLGLNPYTKPFAYLQLNGKLRLYALRDCADQLRKRDNISIEILSCTQSDDVVEVHVRAKTPDGRVDEDFGVVACTGKRGEDLANARLKCITKAKRRVTLSIAGLGFMDETEVETIRGARTEKLKAETTLTALVAETQPAPPPAITSGETPLPLDLTITEQLDAASTETQLAEWLNQHKDALSAQPDDVRAAMQKAYTSKKNAIKRAR